MSQRLKNRSSVLDDVMVACIGAVFWAMASACAIAGYASLDASRLRGVGQVSGDLIYFGGAFAFAVLVSGFLTAAIGGRARGGNPRGALLVALGILLACALV